MSAEDTKLSNLTAIDAVSAADLLYIVDDPSGTPTSKKATAQQLWTFKTATCRLLDTADTYYLTVKPNEALSGNRTLSIVVGDADRTVTLGSHFTTTATGTRTLTVALGAGDRTITLAGALTTAGDLITAGAYSLTLTTTNTTSVTLPTTGTLATLAGTEELTNKTLVTPVLGVATATSINKVAFTAPATGSTLTIADGKTLTCNNTLTFTGTDSSSVAFGTGGTVAYAGTNNAFTGANTFVNATGQTFRPAATQDAIILLGRAGGTGSYAVTLGTGTLSDNRAINFPNAAGTVALTADKLSAFAATTSAELAGVISDETGSGALVFGTSPTFTTQLTTPKIAAAGELELAPASGSAVKVSAGGAGYLTVVNTGAVAKVMANGVVGGGTDCAMFQLYRYGGDYNWNIRQTTSENLVISSGTFGASMTDVLALDHTEANVGLGAVSWGASATYNLALGGGSTTPVLGAAAADLVSLAAVDKAAGDRRLYLQAEAGDVMVLGNNTIYGSTAANGDLTIDATSHATKATSYLTLQSSGGNVGIGTAPTGGLLHLYQSSGDLNVYVKSNNSGTYIKLFGHAQYVSLNGHLSSDDSRVWCVGTDGASILSLKSVTDIPIVLSSNSVEILRLTSSGNVSLASASVGASATYNLVLGGGATTPVLGAATADLVSLAAVDKAAGDRRLYIQSEAGSAISLGNDRLNFAAATAYVSLASVDRLSLGASGLSVLHATSGAKVTLEVVSEDITIAAGTQTKDSTANLLPANSTILDVSYRLKTDGGAIATIDVGSTTNADCYVDDGTCASAGDAGQFTVDGGDATYTGPHANAAAGKIRITTDVNSTGDSVVTVSVAYLQHGAATA